MEATASTGDPLITANGLACVRGNRMLFRGLDFELQRGAMILLRGPNGIGKSSLLRLCAGLLAPAGGSLSVKEDVALCDDRLALDSEKTLARALHFWSNIDRQQGMDDWLARFDLAHLADVPLRYFSTGQRQRARLARTANSGAAIWLLDEPANGLDAASVERLGAAIHDHLAGGGAIVAASHIDLPVPTEQTIDIGKFAP